MIFERLRGIVLGGLMAVALLGPAFPAGAQETADQQPASGVAIINLQKVSAEGAVYRSIREQIGQFRESLQGAIKAEEDELRKADAELARKRTILSSEAYAQERRNFEKRVVEFQRQGQKRQQNLERVQQEALRRAQGEVLKIVQEITVENNLAMVFRAESVLFYASALDITDVVLERLNESLPSVKITEPEQ